MSFMTFDPLHVLWLQVAMPGQAVGEGRGVGGGPEKEPGVCRLGVGVGLHRGDAVRLCSTVAMAPANYGQQLASLPACPHREPMSWCSERG